MLRARGILISNHPQPQSRSCEERTPRLFRRNTLRDPHGGARNWHEWQKWPLQLNPKVWLLDLDPHILPSNPLHLWLVVHRVCSHGRRTVRGRASTYHCCLWVKGTGQVNSTRATRVHRKYFTGEIESQLVWLVLTQYVLTLLSGTAPLLHMSMFLLYMKPCDDRTNSSGKTYYSYWAHGIRDLRGRT